MSVLEHDAQGADIIDFKPIEHLITTHRIFFVAAAEIG